MVNAILAGVLLPYFLTIFQTSFLAGLRIGWFLPNLLVIFLIFISFLEKKEGNIAFIFSLVGGFLWDIYSDTFLGYHVFLLLGIAVFIKFIIKRYFNVEVFQR